MERSDLNEIENYRKSPSRRSSGSRTPIRRQGSRLEVLTPDGSGLEEISLEKNRHDIYNPEERSPSQMSLQRIVNSEGRETHSAGSDGRDSRQQLTSPSLGRSSSESRLGTSVDEINSPRIVPRKQVVLPTVRRDFESHGKPKGSKSWYHCQEDAASSSNSKDCHHSMKQYVAGSEELKLEAEDLDELVQKVSLKDNSSPQESKVEEPTPVTNSYYISHTSTPSALGSGIAYSGNGSAGNGHGAAAVAGTIGFTSKNEIADSDDIIAAHDVTGNEPEKEQNEEGESSSSEESGDEDEEEEAVKAPFELMGEFLEAVMDGEYEVAEKLCTMIQIYEPDNPECLQFKPLIEEMLKREREEQLWGSGSNSDSSSEEDSSEEDSDDDSNSEKSSSEESSEENNSDSAAISR